MLIESYFADLYRWPTFLLDYLVHPLITLILCLLSVFVVLGNIIVVTAIWHENQLHSVTNYLIASLAAADCLVGLVVMPFSIISEIILGSWTFGPTWCDLWHSFDVLASTASIMNLCAISLDRYLAITNPISYPTKMTPKRVALLIVSLWTCSSLISFPAILWWRAVGEGSLQQIYPHELMITDTSIGSPDQQHSQQQIHSPQLSSQPSPSKAVQLTTTTSMISSHQSLQNHSLHQSIGGNQFRCVFTDDTYYLLFSSFISFYGPLCVMLYAYYRIYKAAVQQTRFLKYGSKQVMISKKKRHRYISELSNQATNEKYGYSEVNCDGTSNLDSYERQHLVLRAHRGGGGAASSIGSKNAENNTRADIRRKENCKSGSEAMRSSVEEAGLSQVVDASNSGHCSPTNDHHGKDESEMSSTINHSMSIRSNSCRRARMNSVLDKRDRVRMDSQRFDLSPFEEGINSGASKSFENQSNHNSAKAANPEAREVNACNSSKQLPSKIDLESGKTKEINGLRGSGAATEAMANSPASASEQPSRNLLATINHRKDAVDVSIFDQDNPKQANLSLGTSADSCVSMLACNDRSGAAARPSEKLERRQLCLARGNEQFVELCAAESLASDSSSGGSSVSSGSYGTGSVSSILVRPQSSPQKSIQPMTDVKESCDTTDSHPSHFNTRRALSVDDAEPRWFDANSNTNVDPIEKSISNQPQVRVLLHQKGSSFTLSKQQARNHRSSFGNPPNHIVGAIAANTKNVPIKALDIRHWVRLGRGRSKKADESDVHHPDTQIKPPASLMPLMMMNSDTSTDSSILMGETRTIDTIQESKNESNVITNSKVLDCKIEFADSALVCSNNNRRPNCSPDLKEAVSLDSGSGSERPKRSDIESGDTEALDICHKKNQMLYYDSDKLIQSIVDLKAIHYIDCANQQDVCSKGPAAISVSLTNASDASNDESTKVKSKTEQTSSRKTNQIRNSLPRQKSVGKKLTKLAKERKAAKTLGIVVGVFILCWLPFFVVNIIVAICGIDCIYRPQILLSIVTWLGWLNSAMNPVIYACWSRDFRRAFRRVLCTWVEFLCLYDGSKLARKLRLKKESSYSKSGVKGVL